MSTYMYVDYSNLFVVARYIAAVKDGVSQDFGAAQVTQQQAPWNCYFPNLFVSSKRAVLVTSGYFPARKDAEDAGFEVKVLRRNRRDMEKGVDTTVAVEMVSDAHTRINPDDDHVILVAGDADHVPAVSHLVLRGIHVTVMFWEPCARELIDCATKFTSLMPYWEDLTLAQAKRIQVSSTLLTSPSR